MSSELTNWLDVLAEREIHLRQQRNTVANQDKWSHPHMTKSISANEDIPSPPTKKIISTDEDIPSLPMKKTISLTNTSHLNRRRESSLSMKTFHLRQQIVTRTYQVVSVIPPWSSQIQEELNYKTSPTHQKRGSEFRS